MGECKTVGDIVNIVSKVGKDLTRNKITLMDRSASEVSLTLGDPIVAAMGCRVSDFNGVIVSGGDIIVNRDLDLSRY